MLRHGRHFCRVSLLTAVLAACGSGSEPDRFQGYVEGDYLRIAAPDAGWLDSLNAKEGTVIAAGAPLFTLDSVHEKAALAEARARLAEARSQLADLQTGSRPQEITAIEAQIEEAKAAARLARSELVRQRALARRDVAAQARLDQAMADADQAEARVERASADLAVARLPARADRIAAAEAAVAAATAAVEQAEWRLSQRSVHSPVAALVDDTVRRVGEWVPASGTVVSLLPPDAVKVVFFVPETRRATIRPGHRLALSCDDCPPGLAARVTRIASDAEFTPPVIYSLETRAKLVYRFEAVPEGGTLHPGQPVTLAVAGPS